MWSVVLSGRLSTCMEVFTERQGVTHVYSGLRCALGSGEHVSRLCAIVDGSPDPKGMPRRCLCCRPSCSERLPPRKKPGSIVEDVRASAHKRPLFTEGQGAGDHSPAQLWQLCNETFRRTLAVQLHEPHARRGGSVQQAIDMMPILYRCNMLGSSEELS